MSAKEYVIQYCKITKRRQHLYDNVYRQAVGTVSKPLPYKVIIHYILSLYILSNVILG
jgi:hypothetical protein